MASPASRFLPQSYARIAGVLYLIIIVFGLFGEMFIRTGLIVPGDATATVYNIRASEWLFRIGFASDTIMLFSDVAIAILLYILLKPVSKTLSIMAAAFRLMQASILGMNLLNYYAVLLLLTGAGYAAMFQPDQLHALVMLFLDMHSHGYDLGLLFFGISTLILGYLVYKSGYLPGILGILLIAASFVYLIGSFVRFLFPAYITLISPIYIIAVIAELSFCLWLLIKGIDIVQWNKRQEEMSAG